MTSTPSGKTPGGSPSEPTPRSEAHARGLATALARLGLGGVEGGRRARVEALAEGLLSLRRAVERETLA